jgi:hypothetical protein
LLIQTFYKGLTPQSRSGVDSAAGGSIMSKTIEEAFDLIKHLASHNVSWSSERTVHPPCPRLHQLSASDNIASRVEMLNKQMAKLLSASSSSSVHAIQGSEACQVCGQEDHTTIHCSVFSNQHDIAEVNYAQNQGPFSAGYNPQWRNHPNLSYRNNQQQ